MNDSEFSNDEILLPSEEKEPRKPMDELFREYLEEMLPALRDQNKPREFIAPYETVPYEGPKFERRRTVRYVQADNLTALENGVNDLLKQREMAADVMVDVSQLAFLDGKFVQPIAIIETIVTPATTETNTEEQS